MFTILGVVMWSLAIAMYAGMWRVFSKAGRPGWAAIIPYYQFYVLIEIEEEPGWWMLWLFVPLVNFFVFWRVFDGLAQRFGKGQGFAAGLFFLPFIFFPILGFGSAQYRPSET
ncbi:MAG TPA: DUF5684 domain-containing protein [Holophagaceae bacterium]|nr:DUF5684 domain-containing protein [Holophagaceae bacterium]